MEVVQGGALVCASRAPPSSTHPPLRLAHHRLDGEGPAAAALHVQTEEGGGGGALDPSWWRISASGSWDGGERRMRYGKLVDDRPGVIPGGMQRRKLEMLETHAPGASMRVVHSQSTASWRQDGGDVTSSGMSSSGASRSILSSSSSSSTRVTSYRQWSSNFSQTTSNISGLQQDTRPAITEFGNLELALNPLDVSFLRTRGNVGRSGSIGSRRPPTRPRRLSTDAPSPEAVENNSDEGELKSHLTDFPSDETTGSPDEQPDVIAVSPTVSDGIRDSMSRLLALGWRPAGAGSPTHPPPSPLRSHLHPSSIPLHRKRSVSSEDLRGTEEGSEGVANHMEDGTGGDNDNSGLWERGNVVRRSLPSSEWRSVVGQTDGSSRLLRPRDPLKSSSVPALGGPSSSSRKSSLVTAESLLEMKGRLKHRGSSEMLKATESNTLANGGDIGIRNGVDDCHQAADVSVSLRAAKEENVQDDRRKSWSVGCRNFGKREMVNGDEDAANRRRSYAFEYSADGEEGSTKAKDDLGWMQLHGGSKGEIDHRGMTRSADSHDFTHSRVNEMLKKWSAITQSVEHNEHSRKISSSSPSLSPKFAARGLDMGTSPARKSSTTWLDHGETSRLENGLSSDLVEYLKPATTISGSRTTLRVTHSEDNSTFKDDTIGGSSRSLEQEVSVAEDLPPSSSGQLVEDYSCPRELSPVEWGEGEVSLKSLTDVTNGDSTTAATSAGISVTFSNSEGGESHNNVRQRYSVTRLENKDSEVTKGDGTYKVRTSKKVEFSKTEVHFAAESGRFHIVETAGKPPPSNNFRRRRRSPTGSLNVDSSSSSSVAGGRLSLGGSVGGQSALSNGMRFGDSPYEKRLLAGTEAADISSRSNFDGSPASMQGFSDDENHAESGETSLEYISTSARLFGEQDSAEVKEVKEVQVKIQDLEQSNCSSTFLHPSPEESEKPKGILRSNLLSLNSSPWKSPQKQFDDIDDDTKPKFGGVRLRPVISPELHTRINLSSMESSDVSRGYIHEKSFSDPLSPGQMELQKLLKSLRPVSVASFPTDNVVETQNSPVTQVANGGGMEVRISSGVQTAVTNTVIIGTDSNEVLPPLSVAQRVREVEERRQRELSFRLDSSPKSGGRVSVTRVTLGPVSPNVESVETQVLAKKTAQPIQIATPPSPKSAAKMSTHNKIARIHNTQGDASGHAGDSQHRNPSDVKASTRTAENRTRNEQLQDLPGFTCIAFGFQGVSNDTREHRDGTAAEDDGTGVKGTDSTGCKIFSALSAVKESKEKRIGSNGEDLKPVVIREKSPESHIHARQREYKSSSPSKYLNTGWSGGSAKNAKEENRVKSDAVLKDLRSQKKGKEISSNFESPKKSHYAVISSSSQESKMLSTRSFATERIGKIDGEDDIDEFSAKLKVPEKRAEGRDEVVKNKPSKLEHSQRRTSVESTSSCEIRRDCEKNKRDLGRHETRTTAGGSTFTPRSPRLSEATRFQQRHTSTTITRPASPRQSPVNAELNSGGTTSIGSPASSRAVQKKRVRRRASGSGGKEGASGMEERRKGRKASVGEEMSEESAILAELTRAADEILHAVNGYSDDLTSDDDAMDAKGATAAARSKRRAAKAHSKSTSSAAREAVKGVSNSGSSTGGMSKTRSNSGAVVVGSSTKLKDVTTRVTSKTKESLTKERTQVREGGVGQESPKISGSGSRNHHRVPSPVSTALTSSHGSSGAVVRGGNSSPLASEKSPKSRHQQHQVGGSSSPRVRSAMTRIEPTNRVAEVKLIEKRPPLPPGGPRRGKEGFKERTEVHTRIAHSKAKTSAVITNSANGDSEVSNSETKRTMNIARALEAVMPDARNKTRRTERKMDDTQRKEGQSFHPVSPQLSSRISLSLEKKKVASSRDGDKTTRRGIHHSNNSST